MIISKTPLRIVATILAKNEQDIIANNIEHHLSQGVTNFIVTDNCSTDETRKIVSNYKEVIEIIDEPDDAHNQSRSVTRMARLACKLQPDWIIHLDADELWCGLVNLRHINTKTVGSVRMFLHPPTGSSMRHYLDFSNTGLPDECKIAHRPDLNIIITHGNHGIIGDCDIEFTKNIWRHHYPIRSYEQLARKAIDGHIALQKRGSTCDRWKKWYNLQLAGELQEIYNKACESWNQMISNPNRESLLKLLELWSTEEVIQLFKSNYPLPLIGEWPKI